jgi:hypothetical protein
MGAIGQRLGTAGGAALDLGRRVAGALGPVAALGTGLGLAGLAGAAGVAVNRFASMGDQVDKAAQRIGISREALQEWTYSAGLAGADSEKLERSLRILNRGIGEAATGQNDRLAQLFRRLGIQVRNADGSLRSAADVLPQVADAFARNEDPVTRMRMATALFGEEGAVLIPMLTQGSAELRRQADEARALGLVMSEDAVKSAAALTDAQSRLQQTVTGLSNSIGERLAPVLIPLIERLSSWIASNRELIAQRISDIVERFARAAASVDLDAVLAGVTGFIERADALAQSVGGWEVVLGGLIALMNGPLIASFLVVGKAVATLGATLIANPVGAIVTGIALAALAIYQNWDEIAAFFERVWTGVVAAFDRAGETISRIWDDGLIQVSPELLEGWDRLVAWAEQLWADIEKVFGGSLEVIAGLFTGDLGRIRQGFDTWVQGIGGLADRLFELVTGPFNAIKRLIDEVFGEGLLAGIQARFDSFVGGITSRLDSVRNSALGRLIGVADAAPSGTPQAATAASVPVAGAAQAEVSGTIEVRSADPNLQVRAIPRSDGVEWDTRRGVAFEGGPF